MIIAIVKPLFAWDALEDSPSLESIRLLLESIPDSALLQSLREARGLVLSSTRAKRIALGKGVLDSRSPCSPSTLQAIQSPRDVPEAFDR